MVPSATYRATDFLEAARRLGAEVTVASERRQAMSGLMGNNALTVPLGRPREAAERIARLSDRAPLDAIVAVDDAGVETAALAAKRLGLVHNPPEAVVASRDKAKMREALAAAGIAQPAFRVAGPDDDVASIAAAVGLPCVVKPVGLSGSRGVIRADDPRSAAAAATRIRGILAAAGEDEAGPLLVERFVSGPEVALEGLLRDGRLEVLALFDKPDPLDGPYFEETVYVTPSRHPAALRTEVTAVAAAAAEALGIRQGPLHAELRLGDSGPRILELAARSIGGLCGRALRFGAGVSLEEVILRHALGRSLEGLDREPAAAGVMMIPVPRGGVLQEVRGRDRALAVRGVAGIDMTITPGRPVVPLPDGDRYLGFIYARGPGPQEVESALRAAHAQLDFEISADVDSDADADAG